MRQHSWLITKMQSKLPLFTGKGRCWHLPVSATRLRRYSFAVSRDARRSIPAPRPLLPRPYAVLLGSWLATYDKRIKTIHNDGFRDGPAGEQFCTPGWQPDLLCDRAIIEYKPVVGALMHPAYYLYIVRRRHSRSYTRLVKYLAHEQSLPNIVQRRTNVDD